MDLFVAGPDGEGNVSGNIVCDLDGVLYLDDQGVPGAAAALRAMEDRGFRICFATNNSTRRTVTVAEQIITRTGYEADPARIATSARAAAHLLGSTTAEVFVVGEPGLVATLEEHGLTVTPDWTRAGIVVVGLDRSIDYAKLSGATRAVAGGARFVATNTDSTYPTPQGRMPGGGSLVAAIAVASGVEPEVAGKPHDPMRRLVGALLGPGPTWVVGDRPETDLALAGREGWGRVLVLTGVTSRADEIDPAWAPDVVLDSIAGLPGVLP